AFAARQHNVVAIAITASHNLYQDNGIKIFGAGGRKLSDDEQQRIEHEMSLRDGATGNVESNMATSSTVSAASSTTNSVARPELLQEYCDWLVASVRHGALENLHIALDCANGAFSMLAPEVFSKLGATVTTMNATPDGRNINLRCGATHPEPLSEVVKSVGAHFGVAFDGDGDRLIAVDELGRIVDGDHLLAISALQMKQQATCTKNLYAIVLIQIVRGCYRNRHNIVLTRSERNRRCRRHTHQLHFDTTTHERLGYCQFEQHPRFTRVATDNNNFAPQNLCSDLGETCRVELGKFFAEFATHTVGTKCQHLTTNALSK
ncbi:MAG: hypothetical protein EBZ52_07315, partial [Actinobacteria bacterium]|nr:hypothetical protein [Actinomycetota bacterium]